MQLALEKLGFEENQVIIYAWSIGGFPATWAAMNFPKIQVLEICFLVIFECWNLFFTFLI